MNLRNTICLLFLILSFNLKAQTQSFNGPSWLAPKHELQTSEEAVRFVSELMDKMTLREKIGQLNLPSIGFDVTGPILSEGVEAKIDSGWVGGVFNTYTPHAVRKLQEKAVKNTRLGIPLLLGYDVIHGHR
ncbi:MAG: glycoside hydrolase family 3 N-terminal domain-containing protein, partial [Bacteroidia bacterium]